MPSNNKTSWGAIFFCGIIFVLGVAGWLGYVFYGDQERCWRALLINFIFFTPLATGMIVWPAITIASQGTWAKPLERTAFAAIYFAPVSIVAFIALWIGHSHWAGWLAYQNLPQGFWLDTRFVFIRDIIALLIIWGLCAAFVIRVRKGVPGKMAGLLMFAYGVVFTLIAFDMVMALDPHWFSTLFGGYFFVSGMYAALACWTVLSILSGSATVEHRHDLGKLTVAVSLLTAYMMYSQLLPIWYENLPAEVQFVIPRLSVTQWRYISAILTATIFLGPLVLLLTRWSKRSPVFLTAVSLLVLVCLWIERWWEVTPTLGGKLTFGLIEVSITAAFVAAFLLSVIIFTNRQKTAISG
jgi:hypothetical protein